MQMTTSLLGLDSVGFQYFVSLNGFLINSECGNKKTKMKRFGNVIFVVPYLVIIVSTSAGKLPCRFAESVNITSGEYNATDQSILHGGILYRKENYATVNISVLNNTKKDEDDYIRGCVCQVANCVWLCCDEFSDVQGYPKCNDLTYYEVNVFVHDERIGKREVKLTSLQNIHVVIRHLPDPLFNAQPEAWLMNNVCNILEISLNTSADAFIFYSPAILRLWMSKLQSIKTSTAWKWTAVYTFH